MANHVRRQIREAVVSALTGLTTTGSRVFASRVYPLEAADLPGLQVFTVSESSVVESISNPSPLDRTLVLRVEVVARATADLDDALDGICKEVEIALAMPCAALAGLAKTIALGNTDIEFDGGGDQPTGRAVMDYVISYNVMENAPDVAI